MSRHMGAGLAGLVVSLLIAGCSLLAPVTPGAPPPPGALEYNGPTEQTAPRGSKLPGTDILFEANTPDGARVLIGGQPAIKKTGDSLNWEGSPAPGVQVALAQRVLNANDDRLLAAGTVKVVVSDVAPAVAGFPDKPLFSYKLPVVYHVRRGDQIPGTSLAYDGKGDDGARLTGAAGYPYRRLGDSIAWQGRLRANVYLDVTFRVVAYTDDYLDITGLATLGVTQG